MVYYNQLGRSSSYQEWIKLLEADIQQANALLASIPEPSSGGKRFQMRLVCSKLAPFVFFFLQWLDCSSCAGPLPAYLDLFDIVVHEIYPDGKRADSALVRKATIREFYAIMLPLLRQINDNLVGNQCNRETSQTNCNEDMKKSEVDSQNTRRLVHCGTSDADEEECGICLEPCTKMVLPGCYHALCIRCYRDWNLRSQSCPFCRGGLKRVKSEDLWVLTRGSEVVDAETVLEEDLSQLYIYIQSLPPKDLPDTLFLLYYEFLI